MGRSTGCIWTYLRMWRVKAGRRWMSGPCFSRQYVRNSSGVMPVLRRSAATIFTIDKFSFSRGRPRLVEHGRAETGALATIDHEGRASHIARVIAREKERGTRDLLGQPETTCGDLAGHRKPQAPIRKR